MNRLKWLLPGLLLFAALIILSASARKPEAGSPVGFAVMEVTAPVENVLTSSVRGINRFWRNYLDLVDVRTENRRLKETVDRQAGQIALLTEYKYANERLVKMLDFQAAQPAYKFAVAKVLAWDPGPWFRSVILNVGSDDGVAVDQAVVHYQGVVGRIVDVSPHYSKVLLATDFNSSIDAFTQRARGAGLLAGQGGRPFAMKYVKKDEDVRVGDQVVSSGLDGIFPAGLPLGTITLATKKSADVFAKVEVAPAVDFSRLEEVLVVVGAQGPLDWLKHMRGQRPLDDEELAP